MKTVLLSKEHDITAFCSKDSSRYVLQGVHYNAAQKRLEATNGQFLVLIPVVESEEFPPIKNPVDTEPMDCIIPAAQFKKALANVPTRPTLPILENARLDSNGKVTLTTTDLDTEQSVTTKSIEGTYPDLGKVMPDIEKEKYQAVRLNPRLLGIIVDYAERQAKESASAITIWFKDELSPIVFEFTTENNLKVKGVLMPMRMS